MADSDTRAPRPDVQLNGASLAGVFAFEITSNNHLAADRFSVRAAVTPSDLGTYIDDPDITLDVRMSLGDGPANSLITGVVDQIAWDPINGTLRLVGRDYSARLIESRTHEAFANQTSSDIATLLAGRHGLFADVAATTTPVGRYWELEHDKLTLDQFTHARSEWDLLVILAAHEGFDVWVTGTVLHFQPSNPALTPTMVLRPTAAASGPANVIALRLERALTFARDIQVTVKSWNSLRQTAFSQTATASGGAHRSSKVLTYIYVVPNLSADDALKLAQRKLAEITSHERIVLADLPGELSLAPRQFVAVEGTGTGFDQTYVIDEIERRFDPHDGFTQRVRARTCNAS